MNHRSTCATVAFLVVLGAAAGAALGEGALAAPQSDIQKSPPTLPPSDEPLHVGLRRSSYGLEAKNNDHAWWAARAKQFASHFQNAVPTIIEIVSTYQDDDSTEFEFGRPAGDFGSIDGMQFNDDDSLNHENALAEYDRQGVRAILQVEPGRADLVRCLQLVHRQFGRHPCVIGLGVDAEWFFTKGSPQREGRAITDAEAEAWLQAALALNPKYTFFIKHFNEDHLPPHYRHPRLWFLDDSQQFHSSAACVREFKTWADFFTGSTVGYQFGYDEDRGWWQKLPSPPIDAARSIHDAIPRASYLFWVDFSADRVKF
ncbi:MAG: hypothetical protein ABFC88_10595 [Thermoguttaceae bacterium]